MRMFKLKDLSKAARGITQAAHVGATKKISVGNQNMPMMFATTYMASMSGVVMERLGTGAMSPSTHTRVIAQDARAKGRRVSERAVEYIESIGMLAYDSQIIANTLIPVLGSSSKGRTAEEKQAINRIEPIPVSFLASYFDKASSGVFTDPLIRTLLVDLIAHMLSPLGLLLNDGSSVFALEPQKAFPNFNDLVDQVACADLRRVLTAIAGVNLSAIKSTADAKRSISAHTLAMHIRSALTEAYDLSKKTYAGETVVASVLTTVARSLDTSCPKASQPSERIMKSDLVSSLRGNLAIFLAIQDLYKNHAGYVGVHYNDEEMTSQIIPHFIQAMSDDSPYVKRMVDDVVSFYGKKSAVDRWQEPIHAALFEAYDAMTSTTAFTPVRQMPKRPGRYLVADTNVTAKLNSVLKPVQTLMNTAKIVHSRVASLDVLAKERTTRGGGLTMLLGMPSVIVRELEVGLKANEMLDAIVTGNVDAALVDKIMTARSAETRREGQILENNSALSAELIKAQLEALAYDYYALVMHIAVARGSANASVAVVPVLEEKEGKTVSGTKNPLAIMWDVRTTLVHPLGESAIINGRVVTAEPMETIAYCEDFDPRAVVAPKSIDISGFRRDLHIWDWEARSVHLPFSVNYTTRIFNTPFTVLVEDEQLLSLGASRKNLYYFRPLEAAAVVRMWNDWFAEDRAVIAQTIKTSKNPDLVLALQGRELRNALSICNMLINIGRTGVGPNIVETINNSLADQMWDKGMADYTAELTVGLQKVKLDIWAGLITMALLGVLDFATVKALNDYISTSNVLEVLVASDTHATPREETWGL